jgi:hypothetical protein
MSIRLMAVGDIALGTEPAGNNPFEFVERTLGEADLVFGNLEVPLTSVQKPAVEKADSLRTTVEHGGFLRAANITVVNLAHNHIGDYGPEGVLETIDTVRRAGVRCIGVGRTVAEAMQEAVIAVGGGSIAFVGFFEYGEGASSDAVHIAGMNPQLVIHRVADLARTHDAVVVSFHWGIENVYYPSPKQQALARACVDAGAAVVLGHHSHRFQGIETYKGGVIFYSLGNFNFARCGVKSAFSDLTAVADITLRNDGTVTHRLIPMRIGEDYRPRPMTDEREMAGFRTHVEQISRVLTANIDEWWWLGEIGGTYVTGNLKAYGKRIRVRGFPPAFEMVRWLTARFTIKCYAGIIRRWFRWRT